MTAYQGGEEEHYLTMLPVSRIIVLVMDECMTVEDWWNYTEEGRPLELGETRVSVPLCPPQHSHELFSVQTLWSFSNRPFTNHLRHALVLNHSTQWR
jgi:hypothetical protein